MPKSKSQPKPLISPTVKTSHIRSSVDVKGHPEAVVKQEEIKKKQVKEEEFREDEVTELEEHKKKK